MYIHTHIACIIITYYIVRIVVGVQRRGVACPSGVDEDCTAHDVFIWRERERCMLIYIYIYIYI